MISPVLKTFVIALGILTLSLSLSGCGAASERLDRRDERDPLIVRGDARKRAGDVDGAIELYQQALDRKPQLTLAHLKLAVEYDEYKRDYLRAIYHYSRYLEMRPRAQKNDLVEELIRLARVSYLASLPNPPPGALEKVAMLERENERLRQQLAVAAQQTQSLQAELTEARRELATRPAALAVQPPAPSRPPPPGTGASIPPATAPAQTGARPTDTYRVQRGDTLSRIASQMYNDANQWHRIYEANRDKLPTEQSLREGQVLVIPR